VLYCTYTATKGDAVKDTETINGRELVSRDLFAALDRWYDSQTSASTKLLLAAYSEFRLRRPTADIDPITDAERMWNEWARTADERLGEINRLVARLTPAGRELAVALIIDRAT
jgi:hypothetical protein